MKIFLTYFLFIGAFFLSKSIAQMNVTGLVKTIDNRVIDLTKTIPQSKATVFVFLMPDCPLCEYYTVSLKQLQTNYAEQNVNFYLVFSGALFSKKEIDFYLKSNNMNFEVILDTEKRLARILGAEVTPQAIIISRFFKILYSGKIDNWMTEDRQHRTKVTEFYLSDALRNIMANRAVLKSYTQPIGCFIQ